LAGDGIARQRLHFSAADWRLILGVAAVRLQRMLPRHKVRWKGRGGSPVNPAESVRRGYSGPCRHRIENRATLVPERCRVLAGDGIARQRLHFPAADWRLILGVAALWLQRMLPRHKVRRKGQRGSPVNPAESVRRGYSRPCRHRIENRATLVPERCRVLAGDGIARQRLHFSAADWRLILGVAALWPQRMLPRHKVRRKGPRGSPVNPAESVRRGYSGPCRHRIENRATLVPERCRVLGVTASRGSGCIFPRRTGGSSSGVAAVRLQCMLPRYKVRRKGRRGSPVNPAESVRRGYSRLCRHRIENRATLSICAE